MKNHHAPVKQFSAAFTAAALAMSYGEWRDRGGCALGRVGSLYGAGHLGDVGVWNIASMTIGDIVRRWPAKAVALLRHCAASMDTDGSAGMVVYQPCRRTASVPVERDRRRDIAA